MSRLLFDMDGVLVDVSLSYRMAVQKTVDFFSKQRIGFDEITIYKNRGRLNNDWDLTECILREKGIDIEKKKIISVFQGIYLGKNFDGLIQNEDWLLDVKVLKMLEDKYAMGIVTGRPRIEARYALKRFNMESFFPVLITMDDIPDGKFKPHPFGIELAMAKLPGLKTYYIGDTVDDMIAAKEANAIPIGVINRAGRKNTLKKLLMDHGAVFVLDDINKILEVLS
jgi:HAD superfamily hydrolase (TIGR01548 family)